MADREYEGLEEHVDSVNCLRLARRADYAVVFVGIGAPTQWMKLLLRMDHVIDNDFDSMVLFAERMHKSQTMVCTPSDPPQPYQERCEDMAMLYNGTNRQSYVRTRFTFQNDYVEASLHNRAALVGLDGYMYLVAGTTYWITNTHLCFAPYDPASAVSTDALPFGPGNGTAQLHVALDALRAHPATKMSPPTDSDRGPCANLSYPNGARLFPVDAAAERDSWLSLSTNFLYEYGHHILELRRESLEVGGACAALRPNLAHVYSLYRIDCDIHYPIGWCQYEPALVFRRLAQHRMRIDIAADGTGELRASKTDALSRIPYLSSYSEGLRLAFARLFIMLLTAAVVFVRGNQNASSSRYMLGHVLDTVYCRRRNPRSEYDHKYSFGHDMMEIVVDMLITTMALVARVLVFFFASTTLVADNYTHVIIFELVGISSSLLHICLRYCVLECNLAYEAPLTKLGGPMSICDVAAAVLLAFADPPLLSTDDGRFAAVGRLLIALLIAIQVFTRCAFAAAMCALLANTIVNDRKLYNAELCGYQPVLVVGTALWILQGMACSASMCALFVGPAAYTMTRMFLGDTDIVRFCLFFGLSAACLPTVNKVTLRTLEYECGQEPVVSKSEQKSR